jgi:hypothetical protein
MDVLYEGRGLAFCNQAIHEARLTTVIDSYSAVGRMQSRANLGITRKRLNWQTSGTRHT